MSLESIYINYFSKNLNKFLLSFFLKNINFSVIFKWHLIIKIQHKFIKNIQITFNFINNLF